MASSDTKKLLLDCAEQLFAQEGFHHTSLRILTERAGVNLAAVNYHFGSKEKLLYAVIERRLKPLNEQRRSGLDTVMRNAAERKQPPAVADLLLAFLHPTFSFRRSSSAANNFINLIGRSWNDPDQTVHHCFIKLARPLFLHFADCLRLALPHLDEQIFLARLQFLVGAISAVMCDNNHGNSFIAATLDEDQKIEQLLKFLEAGLEAPR